MYNSYSITSEILSIIQLTGKTAIFNANRIFYLGVALKYNNYNYWPLKHIYNFSSISNFKIFENAYLLGKIYNKLRLMFFKCSNCDRRVFLSLYYYLMRSIEKILCPYRVKIVVFVVAHFKKHCVKDNLFLLY